MTKLKPYVTYGATVQSDSQRLRQERLKYGNDITALLETPPNDDFEDIACFLGPNFCAECD